jgi:uncharacterized integral membrane protein
MGTSRSTRDAMAARSTTMSDQPTDPTTRIPLPGTSSTGSSVDSQPAPPDPGTLGGAPPPGAPPPGATPSAAPPSWDAPPPAWTTAAPAARPGQDAGRLGSIVFGLILLALGLWFFASETLELEMPDISWGQAWPVILILIGAWIVLGTMRRRS